MRRKFFFVMLLRFVVCHNDDSKTLFKIVKAISEFHYFSFYVIVNTNEHLTDGHLYEQLTKSEHLGFPMVVQVPISNYTHYEKNVDDTRRTRCLKIVNGKHKRDRDVFARLTHQVNIGDGDVWLLYVDDHLTLKDYLESLVLPFNVQFIAAYINHSKRVKFFAPYRVSENFPLRMPVIGHWSETYGLNLPIIAVALTRRNLEGFKFRTGTLHYPPGSDVKFDDKGQFAVSGYFPDIWRELGDRLNFTFGYSLSVDGSTGALLPDKTWSGLVGMLIRDEIDVAVSEFTITEARSHVVDFCIPMMTTPLQVFFAQSGDRIEWGSLLRPFRNETWLAILAWFVVAAIVLSLFYALGCRYDFENFVYKQEYSISGSFFIVFRALSAQGSDVIPESSPCRIIFSSAYLMMGIILPSYSAALISYLTVRTPIVPFTSLETMLQAGTHKLSAAKRTAEYSYFSDANAPFLKEVFEKLVKPIKESELPSHTADGMDLICSKSTMAYFGLFLSGKSFIDQFSLERGCKIMYMETPVSTADATIAFREKSPYGLVLKSEVKRMKYDGVLRRIEKLSWPTNKNSNSLKFEAIEIQHVIQIHLVLLSGYLFATFFFLLETFMSKRRRCRGYKKRLRIIQAFPIYQRFGFYNE